MVLEWDGDRVEVLDGAGAMPFYISPKLLKQQVKLVVKHWPFTEIKSHQARLMLCRLYGYDNHHSYLNAIHNIPAKDAVVNEAAVTQHYLQWVEQLAVLGSINQIQAKNLLHVLWPAYLHKHQHFQEKLYRCQFRIYGECCDFVEGENNSLEYRFDDRPSVKDAIEANGIPHPEVGAIAVNKQYVDFNYLLTHGDEIEVFGHAVVERKAEGLLPFKPKGDIVFLLDVHLSRLARYLRMAGFDCQYSADDLGDDVLAHLSATHDYVLLTRDKGLLKRGNVRFARWVRHTDPLHQFKEVVECYGLIHNFQPFSRCVNCNGNILAIEKEEVKPFVPEIVPEDIYLANASFKQCANCQQVYWKGSHYEKIKAILNSAA